MKNSLERFKELANKHKKELINNEEDESILKELPVADEAVYLPTSKKTQAPIPNSVLRSALFGVVGKGLRKFEKNVIKATLNNYTVKYTGEQLDQSDLDVWFECICRCQDSPLGNSVRFSYYDFLKSIERNTGKSQYEWLNESFNRMQACGVNLSNSKYTYIGSLINEIYRDERTREVCLVLNPKIIVCFGDSGWTGVIKESRLKIKGKPLTQWLHGFYSSHSKPLPIKVETLKQLCGSQAELKEFRRMLKKSLSELHSHIGWSCDIDETDKVIIKK